MDHALESGNVAKTCRYFGIPRSSFYRWRNVYLEHGEEGLRSNKPIAKSHPNQTPDEIVEKILYLRRKYHLGPVRIMWYMARYHQMRVSDATILITQRKVNMTDECPSGMHLLQSLPPLLREKARHPAKG